MSLCEPASILRRLCHGEDLSDNRVRFDRAYTSASLGRRLTVLLDFYEYIIGLLHNLAAKYRGL